MRNNRNIRRSRLNASVSRTTEILDDYKLAIAKEVAQAANQIVIQYQNDITRDCRNGMIRLSAEGDIDLLKWDRAIEFAEADLADAIFNFAVEAAVYSQR